MKHRPYGGTRILVSPVAWGYDAILLGLWFFQDEITQK